jgi:DNA-directed RNA polymerase sigma subunit (sigma70/sigma32)
VSEPDPVVDSLEDLVFAVQLIDAMAQETAERAERIKSQRERGEPYRDIVSGEERPFAVDLVNQMTDALTKAGGKFQRAQARALYDEGATMDEIAELFGVTRQRVSALLASTRQPPAE